MLSEVCQLELDELCRRCGENDLTAVRRSCDPRAEMDVVTDVTLGADMRRARV
jgi:hypothetical protein